MWRHKNRNVANEVRDLQLSESQENRSRSHFILKKDCILHKENKEVFPSHIIKCPKNRLYFLYAKYPLSFLFSFGLKYDLDMFLAAWLHETNPFTLRWVTNRTSKWCMQEQINAHSLSFFPSSGCRISSQVCDFSATFPTCDNLVFTFTVSQKEAGRSEWFQHVNNVRTTSVSSIWLW